jgi:hypothetical protein
VNSSAARPDLAPALLAVRLCTGPLAGSASGRSRRFLHSLSGVAAAMLQGSGEWRFG